MESVWRALRTDWQDQALCVINRVNPDDFSPVVETDSGLARINARWCDHCPVKDHCLNSALINNNSGFWGGTSTVQRKALRRTRARAKCPLCTSSNVVPTGEHEVCISCGASWKTDQRPEDRRTKKRSVTPTGKITDVPLSGEAAACL
jgi:WhiB family transcriptional regulator, redox-sensing transcriptional regulator